MFKKVLVANRGEIAVRIIRACRELGMQSVAVYSDADRQGLHVRYADEAYHLGPAPARESYLRGDKIIEIARQTKAGAIHPGYGFLAELRTLRRQKMPLAYIGPNPSAIAAIGDKATARATVMKAGVQVVPGTEGEGSLSDEELLTLAPLIGFPLLIKATAGGGGKGMREVVDLMDMPSLLHAARREAEASFGDGNVYLEKLVEGARHIEVQILADDQGNVIHLGDVSAPFRTHQKCRESPSPFIGDDEEFRQRIGSVAVRTAQAVNYVNAGTIEFLVDRDKNFYFLEMNTRLQVEHPVTELVTGIDIVKEQIRIARGRNLRHNQEDIRFNGWAIECRINAEDPYNNFIPSTGRITHTLLPTGPGIRVDTGVYIGFEISPYYDSLISKLIVWGETRGEAILRMRRALDEYKILGVHTNIPFHQRLLDSTRFLGGQYDTVSLKSDFRSSNTGKQRKSCRYRCLDCNPGRHQQANAAHVIPAKRHQQLEMAQRWERLRRWISESIRIFL
jgi:acetyl-CoA carboxylase biotin carboxylase subunit